MIFINPPFTKHTGMAEYNPKGGYMDQITPKVK